MIAALAAACLLAPAGARAMSAPPGDGNLSPRLAELATPAVRALPQAQQAKRLGFAPSGPGSLLREGNRVLVDVRFGSGAVARLEALRAAGAKVLAASRRYQTVTVAVTPASLRELAAVGGVESVSENRAPLLFGVEAGPIMAAIGAPCEGGSVVSEGVSQLRVAEARAEHDVTGKGVTVGVLSDSYDQATEAADESGAVATHAAEDEASEDLPGPANPCSGEKTPVRVLEDLPPGAGEQPEDEGRAMLQVIHDVAPEAKLAFATAFNSEISFAENIERLAKPVAEGGAGANVIVDDVAWLEEPFFQNGPIANAIEKVTSEGVTYFSAAGNDNLFDAQGREIASWEAPEYRDSGVCPAAIVALSHEFEQAEQKLIEEEGLTGVSPEGLHPDHCMDFSPDPSPTKKDTTFGMTVEPGRTLTVDLQWAEPWEGVGTDLDAFLLAHNGQFLAGSLENNAGDPATEEGATQHPAELLQWKNSSSTSQEAQLVINRFSGGAPRLKFALLENGRGVSETEYPESEPVAGDVVGPTIFGHAAAAGAVSVGAINYQTNAQPERYSSRGPVTHYFGPVSGSGAAPSLPSPESIAKPDIVATDCGATTFFASFVAREATWRFCGTSAAAPHAAGIAALELQAKPAATVAEIREAEEETARGVGPYGTDAVGAGLIDADAAVASLLPADAVTISGHPSSRTADPTPTFSFEVSPFNPTATFTCSIDGGAAQPCSSPYTVPNPLADGTHKFEVRAFEGSTPLGTASFSFTVDTTPPTITFTKRPAAVTAEADPSFGFAANEPAAFTCSVDEAAPRPCVSPYTPTSRLADGPHKFEVAATDQVGNSSHATVEFSVDTVAPTVEITSRPPEKTNQRTPAFGFTSSEPAMFSCSIDAGQAQLCSSPFVTPSRLADGPHTFEVTATDPAGNVGRAAASFTVDTHRPQTFFAEHPRHVLRTRQDKVRATFRFRSNEAGVTFVCKVDRGLLRFCGPRLSRRFDAGRHTVQVKALDQAGNVDRTPAVFHFQVKRVG